MVTIVPTVAKVCRGNRRQQIFAAHGLSQLKLANVAGVSDKAVSTWEQNKVNLRLSQP